MGSMSAFLSRFPGIASILRNGAFLAGAQWAETGLRGIYAILISRWLGPELYGAWSFSITICSFALTLAQFGLETLIPVRLGRGGDPARFLSATLALRLGLLIVATAGCALWAAVVDEDALTRAGVLIAACSLLGRGGALWARAVFQGREEAGTGLALAVALRLAELAAGLLWLALGGGLAGLLAIHALCWTIEAALALRILARRGGLGRLRPDPAALRAALRDAAPLAIGAPLLASLNALPLIQLRYHAGDLALVGQVGFAALLASLVAMGFQGASMAAAPVVARAQARRDPRLRRYPALCALAALGYFGLAGLAAAAFGPAVVAAAMGEAFAPAAQMLPPALLAMLMMNAPAGLSQLLVAEGRQWISMIAGWPGLITLLLAAPPMLDAWGGSGALLASALAWAVRGAALLACARFLPRPPWRRA